MDRTKEQFIPCDCAAYIPCYENGNAVKAVSKDGQEVMINKGIKSVIKALLKMSSLDIHSLRANFSGCINRKYLIPIPLGLDRVLIPVKVRKTIGVNDGAFGYIDTSCIKEVSGDKASRIILSSGFEIDCLESPKTINSRINMANIIREKFASRLLGQWSLKETAVDMASEYSKAATKADIMMLAYEIMKLRK